MPSLGEILRRFRFQGVPGAPALVGVPVDLTARLEAELAPVFGALEDAQRAADDAMAAAAHDARVRRATAVEEGQRMVAEARAGVVAARDEAASALLAQAEVECGRLLADGQAEAARVARVAAERVDTVAELLVAHVLALAAARDSGTRPGS